MLGGGGGGDPYRNLHCPSHPPNPLTGRPMHKGTSEAVDPGRSRGRSRWPSRGLRPGAGSRCSEPRHVCERSTLAVCLSEGRLMGDRSCCSLAVRLRRGVPPMPPWLSVPWPGFLSLLSSSCTSTLLRVSRSLSSVRKLLISDKLPSSELPGPSRRPRRQGGKAGRMSFPGSPLPRDLVTATQTGGSFGTDLMTRRSRPMALIPGIIMGNLSLSIGAGQSGFAPGISPSPRAVLCLPLKLTVGNGGFFSQRRRVWWETHTAALR